MARWALGVAVAAAALTGCTDPDGAATQPPDASGADASPIPNADATDASPSPTVEAAPETGEPDRIAAVRRPDTAREAARRLTWAQRVIDDPSAPPRALVRAARQQQLVYRELGTRSRWDTAVLAGVPAALRPQVRANVASRREFRALHGNDLADTLPAWRIVAPAPAEELLRYYRRGEQSYGIGWEYLAAINLVETAMGRIRGTSVAGAQGPMQFLPSTWAKWGRGGDIEDPRDAIQAAARYLAHDGGARPERLAGALFRYNNSLHYVRGVTHLAEVMEHDPRAFYGYYHWDVYYLTSQGDVRLPVGYERKRPVPVERWLARHHQR
ncbi:MAG TPA: lytic transglycosylase [Nocardioides bacterium]|nr:lytic transglycosylase [Nocardioides sp.]